MSKAALFAGKQSEPRSLMPRSFVRRSKFQGSNHEERSRFIVNAIQNRTIADRPPKTYGSFTTLALFLSFLRSIDRETNGESSVWQRRALFRPSASSGRVQRAETVVEVK